MLVKMPSHPSGMGTHVSAPVVDGSMWKDCGGVPTAIENVAQAPSSPLQYHDGVIEKGAGTALRASTLIVQSTYF